MKSTATPEQFCPLCRQLNHCQVDDIEHCWCQNVTFDKQSLAQAVPSDSKDSPSCICQQCAEKYSITAAS
ncbi:cysteine-rich CWC family protein [Thalassotalea fusca]